MKLSLIRTNKKNKKFLTTPTLDAVMKDISNQERKELLDDFRSFTQHAYPYSKYPKIHQ